MDSSVNLDRAIFPYQDIRYSGRSTGAKPKVRKDVVLAPSFLKPKVPMPGSVVVPKPTEADKNVVVPTSEIAPCSCGGTVCKSVDGDNICPTPNVNTERSVVTYTPPVNNKGKLCIVYCVL